MGKYSFFLYILIVFFQAQILAEMDPATVALLKQGSQSKCSPFAMDWTIQFSKSLSKKQRTFASNFDGRF